MFLKVLAAAWFFFSGLLLQHQECVQVVEKKLKEVESQISDLLREKETLANNLTREKNQAFSSLTLEQNKIVVLTQENS